MRQRLFEQARKRGYETIDLNSFFSVAYRKDRRPLDLGGDRGHWSDVGHAVVADAVRDSKVFSEVFSGLKKIARSRSP